MPAQISLTLSDLILDSRKAVTLFLLWTFVFCLSSFSQKYPPVKFLSEKDRKRILVSVSNLAPQTCTDTHTYTRAHTPSQNVSEYITSTLSHISERDHNPRLNPQYKSPPQHPLHLLLNFSLIIFSCCSPPDLTQPALCTLSHPTTF